MRVLLRRLLKVFIVGFCLWHITAIALYNMPRNAEDLVRKTLHGLHVNEAFANSTENVRWQFAGPYLQITSQWQQWNLFSPDPMRLVVTVDVQQWLKEEKKWGTVWTSAPGGSPWWQGARDQKIIYTITNQWENFRAHREQFLHNICREYGIKKGTRMRMYVRQYILPGGKETLSASFWLAYQPEKEFFQDVTAICGHP